MTKQILAFLFCFIRELNIVESTKYKVCVCVYYCRTYDKAVCGEGGGQ